MNQFENFPVKPLDDEAGLRAREIWDSRTHPIGSLGTLEEMTIQLARITGEPMGDLDKKVVIVMTADNGIYEEDVSSSPQEFTYLLTNAMANGETGVSNLCACQGSDVAVVNIGNLPFGPYNDRVIQRVVREGSNNFMKERALTKEEVLQGIQVGIDVAEDYIKRGYKILGTGELGIANTTTSSAVLAALSKYPVEDCVGLGGGITSKQLEKKLNVIKRAIEKYDLYNQDVFEILSCVGGLDLCGLTGVFLAGAKNGVPVVIDGIISVVAALCAETIAPGAKEFFFASHLSKEKAALGCLHMLGKEPLVYLNMRLGEGSGCPFTFAIFDHALYALKNMGTFDSNAIENTKLVNIRDQDQGDGKKND